MDVVDSQIKKALVSISIEKTLLDIGRPVFESVTKKLYSRYNCYLPDCYDHPEYLRNILQELYGNSYHVIIKPIWKSLDEFTTDKSVKKFVKILVR